MADRPTETRAVAIPKLELGDFDIVRELGRGSMGVVYEAVQRSLDRRVALKTFTATGRSEQALERFKREASAAARLSHPGIVPVWAVGEDEGTHYYAMQLVEGPTLRDVIYRERMEPHRAAVIAKRLAEALEYAHSQSVIHRDLKPANVILTPGDLPVITDFGLAKNLSLGALTQVGAVLGTPTHMAPEQARGDPKVDARTDVYGLGACLYEMLTQRLPFYAASVEELLRKVIEEEPDRPRKLRPEIPPDLETIVLRCLAKAREARYQTAGEVARDLDRFLRGEKISARLPAVAPDAAAAGPPPAPAARGPRRVAVPALAVGLGAALVTAGILAVEVARLRDARPLMLPGSPAASAATAPAPSPAPAAPPASLPPAGAERFLEASLAAIDRMERAATAAEAEIAAGEALEALAAALALDPANERALRSRGRVYLRRARDAEERGDKAAAERWLGLVRTSNPGGIYDAALRSDGSLAIRTRPDGATVAIDRVLFVEALGETRRERVFEGVSPIAPQSLPAGSYAIEISAPGHATATVSVFVERLAREELDVRLLRPTEIPTGFVYVPAGPFYAGGDPLAVRAGPRARIDLPGFFIAEREVTCAEYAEFLETLPLEDAKPLLPRGGARQRYAALFWHDGKGWKFPPAWPPDRPVTGVSFDAATRYAAWRGRRDRGAEYRLPNELEWEKACRGADGRPWPWGEGDPVGRAVVPVEAAAVAPKPVGTAPRDVSIYGVRDMAGNASEWTSSLLDGRLLHRILRGGAYAPLADAPRAAARFPTPVDDPPEHAGIRLACDLPE